MRTHLSFLMFLLFGSQVLTADLSQVKVREAKVYSSAGEDAVVLDVFVSGMMVDIMSTEGQWAQVKLPGTAEMGWVEIQFLRTVSETGGVSERLSGDKWLSGEEMDRVRQRVSGTSSALAGVELRLDSLLLSMASLGMYSRPGFQPAVTKESPRPPEVPVTEGPMLAGETREYTWSNRFIMGKYLRGGEDLYGMGFSRLLDDRGRAEVDFEACYGLGDVSGLRDDFIDWNLGLRYYLKPEIYRIYPFAAAYGGMRHHLKVVPERAVQLVQCSPAVGVIAELGRVFILGVEARAVFLFHEGQRTNEGRLVFSCLYRY